MAVEAWDGSDINIKPLNIAPLNTPIFPVWWTYGLCMIIFSDLVHGIIVFFLFPGDFAAGLHQALDNIPHACTTCILSHHSYAWNICFLQIRSDTFIIVQSDYNQKS